MVAEFIVVLNLLEGKKCPFNHAVDSAPSLGVYYFLSLTLSVCYAAPSNRFFFVSQWNRAIFCPSVLHVALYRTVFFNFWFRTPNPQNLLPKFFYGTCVIEATQLRTQKRAWHHCDIITYHRSWISMGCQTCRNGIQGTTMCANEIWARRGI